MAAHYQGAMQVDLTISCPAVFSDDRFLLGNLSKHEVQLTALCGDLQQRLDTHRILADFSPRIARLFSNAWQKWYLVKYHPDLVPAPNQPGQPPSDHSFGTTFEFHYYRSVTFSALYIGRLPELLAQLDDVGK
jgi:hypothetical protein